MQQKSPPLNYVQGQAVIYLRYHLVWCEAPTLYRMPLHSWSVNADRCVAATKDRSAFLTVPFHLALRGPLTMTLCPDSTTPNSL